MFLDNAVNGGEADAGPFKFVLAMQALKNAKEFVGMARIESGAVIAHKDHAHPVSVEAADLDRRDLAIAREFHGIGKQIRENESEETRIDLEFRQRTDFPTNIPINALGLNFLACFIDQNAQRL
jgi:hypothetical protein